MVCALCKERLADKENTHYLTDGIIRSCLNQEGSGEREKGFYFDLSNNSAYVEFNFQRETSIEKLEQSLGRVPTDEEIEKAKQIPFSVDNVFCSGCEDIFTSIENEFIKDILPKFRNTNLNGIEELEISEIKITRLFFYLQIWRTHICEETLELSEDIAESLRQIILNKETVDDSDINKFPLTITYLETTGDEKEYTTNFVGFTSNRNPYLIFLNDFVIQFFESNNSVRFFDFYNLNTDDYELFINFDETDFRIRIIHNDSRKQFLNDFVTAEKVKKTVQYYTNSFNQLWFKIFGGTPPIHTTQEYLKEIIGDDKFGYNGQNGWCFHLYFSEWTKWLVFFSPFSN